MRVTEIWLIWWVFSPNWGWQLPLSESTSIWWPLGPVSCLPLSGWPCLLPSLSSLTAECSTRRLLLPKMHHHVKTTRKKCSIFWKHHGLPCALAGVTGPEFYMELEKSYHLPLFHQKLWHILLHHPHPIRDFLQGQIQCVCHALHLWVNLCTDSSQYFLFSILHYTCSNAVFYVWRLSFYRSWLFKTF